MFEPSPRVAEVTHSPTIVMMPTSGQPQTPPPAPVRKRGWVLPAIGALLMVASATAMVLNMVVDAPEEPTTTISREAAAGACLEGFRTEFALRSSRAASASTIVFIAEIEQIENLPPREVEGGYEMLGVVHYSLTADNGTGYRSFATLPLRCFARDVHGSVEVVMSNS